MKIYLLVVLLVMGVVSCAAEDEGPVVAGDGDLVLHEMAPTYISPHAADAISERYPELMPIAEYPTLPPLDVFTTACPALDGDWDVNTTEEALYDENGNQRYWFRNSNDESRNAYTLSQYDKYGNPVMVAEDVNADGVFDQTEVWEYDRFQQPMFYERTLYNPEGTNHFCETWAYDGQGNVLRHDSDLGCDGTIEGRVASEYDADGNRVSEVVLGSFGPFDAPDGSFALREIQSQAWTYAANGNMLTHEMDFDGDDITDAMEAWTYSLTNEVVEHVYRRAAEPMGLLVWTKTETFDTYGNLLTSTLDANGDGKAEYTETCTYTDLGHPARCEFDHDGNGALDELVTYDYTVLGKRMMVQTDFDGDNLLDTTYVEFHDPFGRIIESQTTRNGDLLSRESYSYFQEYMRVIHTADNDGDQVMDVMTVSDFNHTGDIVRRELSSPANHRIDELEVWEYDTLGRMVMHDFITCTSGIHEYWIHDDGNVRHVQQYSY